MRLLKRIISSICAVCVVGSAAEGAEPETAPLSDAQIILALTELTKSDAAALNAARQMIAGDVSQDEVFSYYAQDYPTVAALGHGLWMSDRLLDVDWAVGLDEALSQFETILHSSGIAWPDDLDAQIQAQVDAGALQRGDVIGMVYTLLWPRVREAGFRIMSLNTDSDAHMMFLAADAAALRWQSVQIGPNMYFEIADWQFHDQMRAAGHPVDFPKHPATHPQQAPGS